MSHGNNRCTDRSDSTYDTLMTWGYLRPHLPWILFKTPGRSESLDVKLRAILGLTNPSVLWLIKTLHASYTCACQVREPLYHDHLIWTAKEADYTFLSASLCYQLCLTRNNPFASLG